MTADRPTRPPMPRIIDVRILAALDLSLHGRAFILAEFVFSILFCGGMGAFILSKTLLASPRNVSFGVDLLGCALVWLALNYVPLTLHACDLLRRGTARQEAEAVLSAPASYLRMYTWQSALFILMPVAMLTLAIIQEARKRMRR